MKLATILAVALCACASAQTFEQKVVAAVIMAEAWDQGQTGMSAVAEVIHQRSVQTGRSPYRVVTQGNGKRHAFSSLNGRTPAGLVRKFASEPDFKRVAVPLAVKTYTWPSSHKGVTKNATHFSLKEEKPYWAKGFRPVVVIGAHAFYRLPDQL